MSKKIHLLAIDCQADFCDPRGSLFVPGADQDMVRAANLIDRLSDKIDDIHATLDSHRFIDVAHPIMHVNSDGAHPNPFTIISADDYDNGTWRCTNPNWQTRMVDYVHKLEENGRYPLCIWPPHCIISSVKQVEAMDKDGNPIIVNGEKLMVDFCGHSIVYPVSQAFLRWEENNFATVDYQVKGSNILTENYSVLKADVPDPADPNTQLNTELLGTLEQADEILVLGEALSHCVANTLYDIANEFSDEHVKKIILLTDCSSNVPGFESNGEELVNNMVARGMRTATSVDYLA